MKNEFLPAPPPKQARGKALVVMTQEQLEKEKARRSSVLEGLTMRSNTGLVHRLGIKSRISKRQSK